MSMITMENIFSAFVFAAGGCFRINEWLETGLVMLMGCIDQRH